MFENIKRRALKKKIELYLSQRDTSEINSQLRTLGFLVDEAIMPELDKFDDFAREFGLQPKDIKVFTFLEVKKKLPSLRQNQVYNKDFNWKGELMNQNAREFMDKQFDVLVGYYEGKNPFLDLMLSGSKAKFKVGFTGADDRLFDLIIGLKPSDFEGFGKELKKYLTILNKIE